MSAPSEPPTSPAENDKPTVLDHWYGYKVAGLVCLFSIPVPVWLVVRLIGTPWLTTVSLFSLLVVAILASEAWYDLARWRNNAGRPTTHAAQLTKVGLTLGWLAAVIVALLMLVRLWGVL